MGCLSKKDYLFGLSLVVKRELEKERLRIAEEIYKTVNLPIEVIANIVSVHKEKLRANLMRKGKTTYSIRLEEKDLSREIDSITEKLKKEGDKNFKETSF